MKSFVLTLLVVLFGLASVTKAADQPQPEKTKADTNREVILTYARIYLDTKDYARADEMLTEYLTSDDADGNLWLMLGQAQTKEHKLAQACVSFQKANTTFRNPENKLYSGYLFADCLNQGNRPEEAKIILMNLVPAQGELTTSAEDSLRGIETGTIHPGQPLPNFARKGRGKWRVSAAIGGGFDSNVILVDEDVINDTPVSDRGSSYITPALQIGYLGRAFGDAFDSRYIAAYTDYLNSVATSFNSLYQRADASFGSGPIRWGVFGDMLFLNRDPFQLYDWEIGASYLNIAKATASYVYTWEVPIKFQKYTLDSSTGDDNDRTGEDVQVKSTVRWIQGPMQLLNLEAIFDGQYTKGKNYRLIGLDIPALLITPLPGFSSLGLANTFIAEAQGQYYISSDLNRRDLLLKVGTGLLKPLSESVNASLDVNYQKNLSSVVSARYNKVVISLQLSHDFL
jgi:hypothetical protein